MHARIESPESDRRGSSAEIPGHRPFITRDPATLAVLDEAGRAATLPVPVLIRGETGVGKELVAEMVHRASGRGGEPFVAINAAALPGGLFESSLFGHVRGAFTGAVASRRGLLGAAGCGTIFFDEIAELEYGLQAKLLRVLDRGEYIPVGAARSLVSGARVIAATNRDLEALAGEGLFRDDLLYRLSVFVVTVPPLRQRPCDIEPLVEHILSGVRELHALGPRPVTDEALSLLESYPWPGNVRELEGELLRALIRAGGGPIRPHHLSKRLVRHSTIREEGRSYSVAGDAGEPHEAGLDGRIDRLMRSEIGRALAAARGNKAEAARILGIKRTTLLYRMRRLGIEER